MIGNEIIAAIIGSVSSLAAIYGIKPWIDRRFHSFQINENYKHEQAKEIKKTIGKHKSHLIKSAELLHSRLKNYSKKNAENWLNVSGDYLNQHYYIDTTVYRFLSFFAHIKLLEEDLEYLDTVNSVEKDMEMLRYFRIFNDIMTDVELFQGISYDANNQTDHFFKNNFGQYVNALIFENKVIGYDQYEKRKKQLLMTIRPVYSFFDGMSTTESRLRIERIKGLHCILMGFLNHYGYDFHKTSLKKVKKLKGMLGQFRLENGTSKIIKKYKLKQSKSDVVQILKEYAKE